ncbi:hypothetical protein AAY473_027319 [Plecturocebus cupreus]
MNHAVLSTITQGKEENPTALLERLRESLRKSPVTRLHRGSANTADIRRKLQKLDLGPEQSLESLLNLATLVFYNRDQEEQAERNRRDQRKAAALVMAFRQADPRGSEEGRAWFSLQSGRACYHCGLPGHFKRDHPQGMDHLLILAHCAKGITRKHIVPGDEGSQGLRWQTR